MSNKEKQLLLKDLSARLPYGVKVHLIYDKNTIKVREMGLGSLHDIMCDNAKGMPYLRPLSSMTKEEREYVEELSDFRATPAIVRQKVDFYLERHLDYRGLIPMGLALEALEGMYKIK